MSDTVEDAQQAVENAEYEKQQAEQALEDAKEQAKEDIQEQADQDIAEIDSQGTG
jgi:hypothetical protein